MQVFLSRISDARLSSVLDSVPLGDSGEFKKVLDQFPEYDSSFLWLLAYSREDLPKNRKYIEGCYRKFEKVLDRGFPTLLATKGNFVSRMWELVLCDILSSSGELKPKSAKGADFILNSQGGQKVQIEAIAPEESNNKEQRAPRPDYSRGNVAELGGLIHDTERPIVLRTLQAFSDKKNGYDKNEPLILAINSSKTVGFVSDDTYILRRILFGLGNWQLYPSGQWGFEQLPYYNKPGETPFLVSYFRRPEFSHISGVIYSSQNPLGFIPDGYSWHNSGITFVPNPLATHPVALDFLYFKKIICTDEDYQEFEAPKKFESSISLN